MKTFPGRALQTGDRQRALLRETLQSAESGPSFGSLKATAPDHHQTTQQEENRHGYQKNNIHHFNTPSKTCGTETDWLYGRRIGVKWG